jgi:hypothetical protein
MPPCSYISRRSPATRRRSLHRSSASLASALPHHSHARPNCVRPWPAPHLLRPPLFCSHAATLRPQLRLRLRRVPVLLAARTFTLLRRRLPRLPALLFHRARATPPCMRCSTRAHATSLHIVASCSCSPCICFCSSARAPPRRSRQPPPLAPRSSAPQPGTRCYSLGRSPPHACATRAPGSARGRPPAHPLPQPTCAPPASGPPAELQPRRRPAACAPSSRGPSLPTAPGLARTSARSWANAGPLRARCASAPRASARCCLSRSPPEPERSHACSSAAASRPTEPVRLLLPAPVDGREREGKKQG